MEKPSLAMLLMASTALGAAPLSAQQMPDSGENEPATEAEGGPQADISIPGGGLSGQDIVVIGRHIPNPIRATPSVVSVLSMEDMSRGGEGDIAGALKRVTGLSVVGGKYVYVRGLGERYSLALLNGLPIPSPEPLRRVVPLDIFPTDILASTMVQKSYSVNFPGEFGGGVINLTTRAIPEESFLNISGSVGGNTETTLQTGYTYYGSRTDWTGFDNGARSIPTPLANAMSAGKLIGPATFSPDELKTITASLSNANTNLIQRNDDIPANFSVGFTGGKSWDIGESRIGLIFSGNWSNEWETRGGLQQSVTGISVVDGEQVLIPNQDYQFMSTENRVKVNALVGIGAEFGEHSVRLTNVFIRDTLKEARIQNGINEINVGSDRVSRNYTSWFNRQLFSTSAVGDFNFGDFHVDLRGTWAKSHRKSPYERVNSYRYSEEYGDYFNDLRTNGTGSTIAFSNLGDEIWAGGVDLAWDAPTARPLTVTAGYAYTDNTRSAVRRDFTYESNSILPAEVSQQRPDYLLSDFNVYNFGVRLRESSGALGAAAYDAGLEVHAGYGQIEAELADGLRVTAGVRYEDGKMFVTPLDLFGTGAGSEVLLPTRIENSYWLPAATVTWNFAEDMQLRFSGSKTIARPQFRELARQTYLDTDTDRTSFGNPFLVDSELVNVEGRYEWYMGRDERLQVGAFWKKIDRPIETVSFQQGGTVYTTFANAPEATLYGAEAEVQKFIPLDAGGWLTDRRILLSGNYTYTKSEIKVGEGDVTYPVNAGGGERPATDLFTDGEAMTGQSDHIGNVQIGLQREGTLSEQTLLFTYASTRVAQRGPGATPDIIEKPGIRLDLVLREEIDFGSFPLELKFEARNLTGTGFREYQELGASRIYTNKYDLGRSFSFGVTAKF
ncbi:MAG: TonB-dependent receptor [Sphingomonadaceae bacterium]